MRFYILLNEKANELGVTREASLFEKGQIVESLAAPAREINATTFRNQLIGFAKVVEKRGSKRDNG